MEGAGGVTRVGRRRVAWRCVGTRGEEVSCSVSIVSCSVAVPRSLWLRWVSDCFASSPPAMSLSSYGNVCFVRFIVCDWRQSLDTK